MLDVNTKHEDAVRVFTQLCTKVNISLFDRTMTIYPKANGVTVEASCLRADTESKRALDAAWSKLGAKCERNEYYFDHEKFHQDTFSKRDWHTHIEFKDVIDVNKLSQVLDEFVSTELISLNERDKFIQAYKIANQIPRVEYDKVIANNYLDELKASINKKYKGFRKKELMAQASAVVDQFDILLQADDDVHAVQRYIKETQLAIENPTKDNITRLYEMGMKAQGSSSFGWQVLGVSLMLLGVTMMSFVPVSLGLFAAGAACFRYGMSSGLSRELTTLSNTMKKTLDEECLIVGSMCP